MSQKIIVPTLGESVTEATVSKWLKNKGDKVLSDEPLVELETDKVNVEVPSPSNGTLNNISVKEGETVNVGALLGTITDSNIKDNGIIENEKEYNPPLSKPTKVNKIEPIKEIKKEKIKPLILEEDLNLNDQEKPLILSEAIEEKIEQKSEIKIAPSARKIATEAKINLENVHGCLLYTSPSPRD